MCSEDNIPCLPCKVLRLQTKCPEYRPIGERCHSISINPILLLHHFFGGCSLDAEETYISNAFAIGINPPYATSGLINQLFSLFLPRVTIAVEIILLRTEFGATSIK